MNIKTKQSAGEIKGGRRKGTPTPLGVRGVSFLSPISTSQGNDVEKTKELCRGLDVRQRKEVRDYISYLDKEQAQGAILSSRPSQALTREEEMWADSLEQLLGQALGTPPAPRMRSAAILGSLRDSYARVHAFVQAAGLSGKMSYDRKVTYNLLAGFVVEYSQQLAAKIGAPLTFKFVLQNVEKLPALFDRAYPGYAAAGLAGIVIDQLINSQPKG